jgi:tetratricopeptide (TPR) repeat protein
MSGNRLERMRGMVMLVAASLPLGCSHLPGRASIAKLGLPSPKETIASAERRSPSAAGANSAGKRTDRSALAQATAKNPKQSAAPAKSNSELARGIALERRGDYDKARKLYEAMLQRDPQNIAAIHRLGIVADAQGRHVEAEKHFLAALRKEPRNAEYLSDLGYCYYLQGKLEPARQALTQATSLAPHEPRYHNNLGLVLGHLKDYDGAFAEFSAAGSEADAYYNMAFVFAAQDLSQEAKLCFQRALDADPKHHRAREALASFEEYDRTPAHLRDRRELADDGIRYVPYIEEGDVIAAGHDGQVQPAAAASGLPSNRFAGRATRSLQLQSRGLLSKHMQSQRQSPQKSEGAPVVESASLLEVQAQ